MNRLGLVLAVVLLIVGPFGEGGRNPGGLAASQLLILGLLLAAVIGSPALAAGARPRGRGTGLLLLPVAALGVALLSAFRAAYPYAALLGLMDRLAVFGAFVAAAFLFGQPPGLLRLRAACVASTSLQAGIAIVLAWSGGAAASARVFQNRSHLGAFLVLGLMLSAAALLGKAERGERRGLLLWGALALLHVTALLPLQSRGALLGAAVGSLLLLARRGRRLPGRWRAAAAIAVIVVLAAGAFLVHRRFAASDDPDRYTRLSIWSASLRMVGERPLLGFGPGQFAHAAPAFNFPLDRSPVRYGRAFSAAHSLPLTLAAEDGLVALALIAALAAAAIGILLRRHRPGRVGDALCGTGVGVAALAVQGLVEDVQQRPAILLAAALLAGAACAVCRDWRRAAGPEARGSAPERRLVAGAIALLLLWVAAGGVVLPYLGWREATAARAAGARGLAGMRRAARLDPKNAAYHRDLAMAALQGGPPDPERYAAAAIELDAARACAPRDAGIALLRARLEAVAARALFPGGPAAARATALYAEAVRLAPTDPRPRFEAAGELAVSGRLESAIENLTEALDLEPHYLRARLLLADLERRAGHLEAARGALSAVGRSDAVLGDYVADSGYAAEIVADDPRLRASLASLWSEPND